MNKALTLSSSASDNFCFALPVDGATELSREADETRVEGSDLFEDIAGNNAGGD